MAARLKACLLLSAVNASGTRDNRHHRVQWGVFLCLSHPLWRKWTISFCMTPRTLSIKHAAAYVGVCESTFRTHIQPHITIVPAGRRKLVLLSSLDDWLSRHDANASAPKPTPCTASDWLEKLRVAHDGRGRQKAS